MKRIILLSSLALALSGGAASADRWRGEHHHGWSGGVHVRPMYREHE